MYKQTINKLCKKMKGCVVTKKTLVCYDGDEKPFTNKQKTSKEPWFK